MAAPAGRDPGGLRVRPGHRGRVRIAPERFAESFAKWATGDIGLDLFIGYKVLPPDADARRLGRPARGAGR